MVEREGEGQWMIRETTRVSGQTDLLTFVFTGTRCVGGSEEVRSDHVVPLANLHVNPLLTRPTHRV